MWKGIGMNLIVELAALSWILATVFLSLWTWHDAWYLAYSRLWSVAVLIFGPPCFLVYVYRSRWYVHASQSGGMLPGYDIRLKHRTATRRPDKKPAQAHDVTTSEGSGSSLLTDNRAELPRCPACRTAISFYDVKCMKCGKPIAGVRQNAA